MAVFSVIGKFFGEKRLFANYIERLFTLES
jgi:hypothetical protein